MRSATSELRLRNARKSRRSSRSSSQCSIARTVALRGLSESSAISPNTSPGPITLNTTSLPSLEVLSALRRPSITTKSCDPASPLWHTSLRAATVTDLAAGTSASRSRGAKPWNSGTRASSSRLRSGVSTGAGAIASGERRAQRRADLGERFARPIELGAQAQEAVEHARVAGRGYVDARLAQPRRISLPLVAQRVVARGDAQPRREVRDVRGAQRRRVRLGALLRARE